MSIEKKILTGLAIIQAVLLALKLFQLLTIAWLWILMPAILVTGTAITLLLMLGILTLMAFNNY